MRSITVIPWVVATALAGAACHTMRPITLDELTAVHPSQVRVTRGDQSVVLVEGPRVSENRLLGFVDGQYQAMPMADVKQVLVRTPAPRRTAALITGATLGIAAFAYMVSGTGSNPSECNPDVGDGGCVPGN